MKIGILTFHQSVNNGAVMQAYSLSRRLKEEYPEAVVEIIDYRRESVEKAYSYTFFEYIKADSIVIIAKKFAKMLLDPQMLKRMKRRTEIFHGCISTLPLSKEVIVSDETEEVYAYIENNYDVLIVGSDAVWNYVTRGFPNVYFPKADLKVKKLSYAASCYGMDYLSFAVNDRDELHKVFSDFDFIGVRDEATENFVKWTGCKKDPYHTCDPTVMLDVDDLPINVSELEKKLRQRGFDFNKPTIGIMGSDKMLRMVKGFYGSKYQFVSLYNYIKGADVNLYDLEPYEWAYVFRYFKLTFTTFFHGTLLSLRNGVPLICLDLNTDFGKKHTPKTLDVLKRLGFEEWYFSTDYKSKNFDIIKAKADDLLAGDYHDEIISAMDKEAESFEVFNKALKSIIGKDENND
jgi:hypothetical protein